MRAAGQRACGPGAPPRRALLGSEDAERPHLAIEVVWTSGGLDKLDVYRKLGVREVWYCAASQRARRP